MDEKEGMEGLYDRHSSGQVGYLPSYQGRDFPVWSPVYKTVSQQETIAL